MSEQPIFKEHIFKRDVEWNNGTSVRRMKLKFLIPGVNSGIYTPTLYIEAYQEEWEEAHLFKFNYKKICNGMQLTPSEFDDLYEEMTKIKKLRDALKTK